MGFLRYLWVPSLYILLSLDQRETHQLPARLLLRGVCFVLVCWWGGFVTVGFLVCGEVCCW